MMIFEHFFKKRKIQRRNFHIFAAILIGAGLIILFYYLLLLQSEYYLFVFLVAGIAGLIVETIGTRLDLWEYYTKKKPPLISFFGWGAAVTIIMWVLNVLALI